MVGVEASAAAEAVRRVGRYELFSQIAQGGMATVHLGRVLGAGGFSRPVAIKRLHAQYAGDADFRQMFLNEAEVLSRIRHPNVVPTLDLIERAGALFIVMEFIEGLTLKHLQKVTSERWQPIPTAIAVSILEGVLRGLHAAHEARDEHGALLELVHRDVSPDNVLVGRDGLARVFDFGIAKALGKVHTTQDGQVKGKVPYMTPEQLLGEPVTRRSDVFAASIVLWETLTGERLFAAPDVGATMRRVLLLEIPAPSTVVHDLPKVLDEIVLRGLERDPANRFPTAAHMADELAKFPSIASLSEVSKWIQGVAGARLAETVGLISKMEKTAPLPEKEQEATFEDDGRSADAGTLRRTSSGATPAPLSMVTTPPSPIVRRRGRRVAIAAGAMALAGLVAGVALTRRGTEDPGAASAGSNGGPTITDTASAPPPATTPSAPSTPSAVTTATTSASASAPPPRGGPVASAPSTLPSGRPGPSAKTKGNPGSPLYTLD